MFLKLVFLLAHASFCPSGIWFPIYTLVSVMSTAVLKHISLFLPSVALFLIHMELFFFFFFWSGIGIIILYKMNNHNKVIQLELMAISSVCAGGKKAHLKKVPSFHCNTSFSLVPVILSLSTFCGGNGFHACNVLGFSLVISLVL